MHPVEVYCVRPLCGKAWVNVIIVILAGNTLRHTLGSRLGRAVGHPWVKSMGLCGLKGMHGKRGPLMQALFARPPTTLKEKQKKGGNLVKLYGHASGLGPQLALRACNDLPPGGGNDQRTSRGPYPRINSKERENRTRV